MGQRLNLEIITRDECRVLACGYYHWSGYTYSAVQVTETLIEAIRNMGEGEYLNLKEESEILLAIRLLEATGAGLCEYGKENKDGTTSISSKDYAHELFPDKEFKPVVNRNVGLIEITSEGIASVHRWEEAKVQFCIDDLKIDFFSAICMDTLDDYLDWQYGNNTAERAIIVLPRVKVDLSRCNYCEDMTIDQFYEFVAILDDMDRIGAYAAMFDMSVFEEVDGVWFDVPKQMVLSLIA